VAVSFIGGGNRRTINLLQVTDKLGGFFSVMASFFQILFKGVLMIKFVLHSKR
jgi:hypothetical protein